jgi:hypothetical protein
MNWVVKSPTVTAMQTAKVNHDREGDSQRTTIENKYDPKQEMPVRVVNSKAMIKQTAREPKESVSNCREGRKSGLCRTD